MTHILAQRNPLCAALAITAILSLLFLASCTAQHFSRLTPPADTFRIERLDDLPWRELWQGFIFNGEKVGFTRLSIEKIPGSENFRIVSEAELRILFIGMEKQISTKSDDIVGPDLTLVSFRDEEDIGGGPVIIEGEVKNGVFTSTRHFGDTVQTFEETVYKPLYPASVINLYPVVTGISVGSRLRYTVYDPQSQSFAEVTQSVVSFEQNDDLAIEPSYKLISAMSGQEVSTWINPRGEAVFELGMGGVLITVKETESEARRYLIETGLNKKDFVLDFSLVKTEKELPCPRETTYLEVTLDGIADDLPPIQGPGQTAAFLENGKTILYRITSDPAASPPVQAEELPPGMRHAYLSPAAGIESDSPEIREAALRIVAGYDDAREQINVLSRWIALNVADEAVDNPSALKVLRERRGECQAHTLLFAALARSLGIPTRLIAGLLYIEGLGFFYHSWAECRLDGWIAVDPTLGQTGIDATHIKLVEGPYPSSVLKLGNVVGKVRAEILDYRSFCQ